jgi:dihydrofolate reductase
MAFLGIVREILSMPAPYRIEGYVIVSANGMIADDSAVMPEALKIEADHRFLERELDRVDAVVHGRNSHEGQPNSPRRPRLLVTRTVGGISPHPDQPNTLLWNPAGARFDEACRVLGRGAGTIAVLGGADVYCLFLDIGYDAFHVCRANKVTIKDGLPVFPQMRFGLSPEDVLRQYGLEPGPMQLLDDANDLSLVSWTRKTST